MATKAYSVDELLGVTGRQTRGALAVARSIQEGLPIHALDRVAAAVAPGDTSFRYRLVPKPTLDRRKRSGQRLTSDEGNRVARLAKVYAMAMTVFRDEIKAHAFLSRPHQMLDGEAPLDVAIATGPGADEVVHLLGAAAAGVAV